MTILVKRGKTMRYYQPIVPTRWQGEVDCVIGPFSSHQIAEYFAARVVDFGRFGAMSQGIFASGDSWFVEAQQCLVKDLH